METRERRVYKKKLKTFFEMILHDFFFKSIFWIFIYIKKTIKTISFIANRYNLEEMLNFQTKTNRKRLF
jgi:hypothetical protein